MRLREWGVILLIQFFGRCKSINFAFFQSSDSWVVVQSLQTSDGGILDPDDRLNDVADDREQIVATFSDGDGPLHGGGDGASGSSVGTESPDIFQVSVFCGYYCYRNRS